MLSLSNGGMSAGQAGQYFAKEDYYLKGGESSQWLGKSAEVLGLQGPVQEKDFRNVIEGKSPDGKEQLVAPKITKDENGNQVESHRAGNDLTFSAPKSVSVGYAAGVRELKEIWDQAVINTMQHVEQHYGQYRSPDGMQTSGTIVAAKFDHVTSRALDPEVHNHIFFVNMTQDKEGGWKANEPKNVYTDKIALGMLSRQEAIRLYEKAGFETYFTNREQMLFEVKGVSQQEMEAFSKRSAAIADKVAEWKAENRFPGVTDTMLKQMAALDTRDPKVEVTKDDVQREWDKGFAAAGTTKEQVSERIEAARQQVLEARQRPQQGPGRPIVQVHGTEWFAYQESVYDPKPDKSAGEVMKQASDFLTDKEAVLDRAQLLKTAVQISGGKHSIEDLNTAIDGQAGKDNGLERMGQETHGRQAGREFYTTKEMRELEARNIEALKSLGDFKSISSRSEVEAYLAGLAREDQKTLAPEQAKHMPAFEAGLAAADQRATQHHDGRVNLTEGQRLHIINELAGEKGYTVTQGDPGTGKTFASEIVERFNSDVLEPSGRGHYTLNVAYTGKAALEMSEASGKPTYTIDSFLNRYHNGRIEIEAPDQVRNRDQAVMTRAERISVEAERHAGKQLASGEKHHHTGTVPERAAGDPASLAIRKDRENDAATITKSTAWGEVAKGTTTTIRPAGRIIETKWEGREGGEGFEVLHSSTRETESVKRAERQLSETGDRKSLGVVHLAPESGAQILPVRGDLEGGHTEHGKASPETHTERTARPDRLRVPAGAQVVLKVDEASFVGGRQTEQLLNIVKEIKSQGAEVKPALIGDQKQMQGIQASPFFTHASDVAKQGYGDYAAMKEINRQKNPELLKVAETLNRDGGQQQFGANAQEALGMLQRQGRVTEISDRQELTRVAVSYYVAETTKPSPDPAKAAAGEKQSVLLVTPLNADRQDLNREIREARVQAGQIERGQTFDVLTQVRQGVTAGSYKPGMIIVASGHRDQEIGKMTPMKGTYLNQQGEVQSVNLERNTVTVRFGGIAVENENGKPRPKIVTKTFDAAEMAEKTTLYQREQKEFSEGERIVFGKNAKDQSMWSADSGKDIGVRNGEMGEIEKLSDFGKNTVALVRLDDGRKMNIHLDHFGPQVIDHGYAVTIHKGQGGTVDSVIPFHYVKPGTENDKSALETIAGVKLSDEQFQKWSTSLSDYEKNYQADVKIGEHGGNQNFVMILDQRTGHNQKGIAIQFHNGKAIIDDEATRLQMREAGMYWSKDIESWVTGVTNDKAAGLMDSHPLKDPQYSAHLESSFSAKEVKEAIAADTKDPVTGERNYQTEIDTTANAEKLGHASYNAFNVAITRARHAAMVFTNSITGLAKSVMSVDEKTSTVDNKLDHQKEGQRRETLTEKIDSLKQAVTGPQPEHKADSISQSISDLQDKLHSTPSENDKGQDHDHANNNDLSDHSKDQSKADEQPSAQEPQHAVPDMGMDH